MKTIVLSLMVIGLFVGCNGDDKQVSATGAQPAAQSCVTKARVSGHPVVEDCK